MGVQPDVLAKHLTENNQIPAVVSEVLRTKALNLVVEHVKAKDERAPTSTSRPSSATSPASTRRRRRRGGRGRMQRRPPRPAPRPAEDKADA